MQEYYEELRPNFGEIFQIHIQKTTDHDEKYTEAHVHDFVEVLYCLQGTYTLRIDDEIFTFAEGDMAVIGSKKIHAVHPLDCAYGEYLVVKFQLEMIYASYQSALELKYVMPFLLERGKVQNYYPASQLDDSALLSVFSDIIHEITERSYGYEIALKANIYKIVLFILRRYDAENHIFEDFTPDILHKMENALAYIENHYTDTLTVKEIAEAAYMEYTYFSRIFKKMTAMNCCDYINRLRVQKAQILLLESDCNITELSARVGFENVSYFIKQFKKVNGISPKQYRKEMVGTAVEMTDDEKIDFAAAQVLKKYRRAFEELAK